MRRKIGIRMLAVTLAFSCGAVGCGSAPDNTGEGDTQLLNPVGVSVSYETAALRNLYDSQIYSASVCPYVEEYSFEDDQRFSHYDAYPGQSVSKGSALLSATTEDIDDQIEELEKKMEADDQSFQDYLEDIEENLKEPRKIMEQSKEYVDRLELETGWYGNGTPQYLYWKSQFDYWDARYQDNKLTVEMLEEDLREHRELYNLDREYDLSTLSYLQSQRGKSVLSTKMNGEVAGVVMFNRGQYVEEDRSVIAVGDPSRKMLRCEYINGATVMTAQDVYAIVDGVRYEVEYEPMSSREYERLAASASDDGNVYASDNGKVYSTFYFKDGGEDVEIGSYAVIVIMKQSKEQVLTISGSSLYQENGSYYVYVSNESGDRVYTPVQTGMRSGMFVEIVSGLSEGDKVLAQSSTETDGETTLLEYGSIFYDYKAVGYLYYPAYVDVKTPTKHGACYLVESNVVMYERVEEGQVLAKVRIVPDEIELQRNQTKLSREQERLSDLLSGTKEEQKANRIEIRTRRRTIAELEEVIAEIEADYKITEIRSPITGIITGLRKLEENQLLPVDAFIFEVSSEDHSFVVVEDQNHVLNYGNPADITYTGKDGEKKTVTGRVVTLQPSAVSDSLRQDWAFIAAPAEAVGDMSSSYMGDNGWWNRELFDIAARTRSMDNVLLVPKRAVLTENGQTYVKVRLEDGQVVTQGFLAGGSDTSNYWVVEGLAEGTEICLE